MASCPRPRAGRARRAAEGRARPQRARRRAAPVARARPRARELAREGGAAGGAGEAVGGAEGDDDGAWSEDDFSWYTNKRTHHDNRIKTYANANFPKDPDGRVYHLGFRRGDVANRIISVGDVGRAEFLSTMLEPAADGIVHKVMSSRGFVTYTGRYNDEPVSIIATLMGVANMDMVVREARAVIDGDMAVVRLGTCGGLQPDAPVGTVVVASKGAASCYRNPDAFGPDADAGVGKYHFSKPVPADGEMSALLVENLRASLDDTTPVVEGLDVTACSFYSSQGRVDAAFIDHNEDLTERLVERYPDAMSLEMETFHLLDLCRCSHGTIKGAAAALVLAARFSNEFIDSNRVAELMEGAGRAVFETVSKVPLDVPHGMEAYGDDCVWH